MKGVILEFTTGGFYACDGIGQGIALPLTILGALSQSGCEQCPKYSACRMSHWTQVETSITDLEALESACKELGLVFAKGQTSVKWYGRSVGDYPLPPGVTADQLGKGDHAIKLPGCEYEVAVIQDKGTGKYKLAYDFWGPGMALKEKMGENAGKLLQMYGVHKATKAAKAKGYTVRREKTKTGTVLLTVTV